jgi:hypothetical protein
MLRCAILMLITAVMMPAPICAGEAERGRWVKAGANFEVTSPKGATAVWPEGELHAVTGIPASGIEIALNLGYSKYPYISAGPVFQLLALSNAPLKKPSGYFRPGAIQYRVDQGGL